ncbi:hypothetical protein [Vreelandella aquamarina]|uniref:Uncharacterized protein n=1 Tax=Vreelandella aquamarina TaxID=77097 RepID=A0A857GN48_9GAMM|nr:hypothetical protein [Halomonas meridiana]QHD50037.1 hypothetical protein CTT34_10215 [Halomonas meridiana]
MNYDDWLNVSNPWAVVEAAARSDVARDAAVKRIIDTMLELQLDMRHENIGYQPFSVASMAGEVMGGGGRSDQAMIAAMRYHPESAWHRACAALLDRLPKRQAAAMLLQAARIRPEKMGDSDFMVTARQMIERQDLLLRRIGFRAKTALPDKEELKELCEEVSAMSKEEMEMYKPPTPVRPFHTVKALQDCAFKARRLLQVWIEQKEIQGAA